MNNFNLIRISLIFITIVLGVNGEKFSAISEMKELAYDEENIIEEYSKFVDSMENEVKYMRRKLIAWKAEYENVKKDVEKYITNPINAFLMIKRTSSDFDYIAERIKRAVKDYKINVNLYQPTNEDLDGAVSGLLRLQNIYDLKASDIVNGIIQGQNTGSKLTSRDILMIVKNSVINGRKGKIIGDFFKELKLKIINNQDEDEFEKLNAENVMLLEKHFGLTQEVFNVDTSDNLIKDGLYSIEEETAMYQKMCQMKSFKSPKESKALKCRLISNSPFSLIAPFKVEEADHSVNLLLFHDVVHDSEIEILKNLSKSRFTRGLTYGNTDNTEKTEKRVAKVAWLGNDLNEVISKISKRIEDMTGLTMETAEDLQIQNYGIGGHYIPHWDMKIKTEPPFEFGTGNRIATVLFYLSTVEKGGATVFPYLKVYVPAVKGMAAFWFNLRDNGDDDYYTRHAACPVLLGSKWVANKWIHESGQEFRRPCSTEYQEPTSEEKYISEFY